MFHTESKGLPIPGRLFCLSGVPELVGDDAHIVPGIRSANEKTGR